MVRVNDNRGIQNAIDDDEEWNNDCKIKGADILVKAVVAINDSYPLGYER